MAKSPFSEQFQKALDRERSRLERENDRANKASDEAFKHHQRVLSALQSLDPERLEEEAANWVEVYP